jgi:sulfite reductase (NADPH) flavoprotein alpha-component
MTDPSPPLTILFATVTGNALTLAEFAHQSARLHGLCSKLADAATYDFEQLAKEETMLVIMSTRDGEPPYDAVELFEYLETTRPVLSALRYAVIALGDSAYDSYCAAGTRIDVLLHDLGATRLRPAKQLDAHEHKLGRSWVTDFHASR